MVPEDDLRALLKTSNGTGFEDRRDAAIIRLFRFRDALSELTGLGVVDMKVAS